MSLTLAGIPTTIEYHKLILDIEVMNRTFIQIPFTDCLRPLPKMRQERAGSSEDQQLADGFALKLVGRASPSRFSVQITL